MARSSVASGFGTVSVYRFLAAIVIELIAVPPANQIFGIRNHSRKIAIHRTAMIAVVTGVEIPVIARAPVGAARH